MKEELNALKDGAIKIAKAKETVLTSKSEFNTKVEQMKQELGVDEVYKQKETPYENAKALYETFSELFRIIETKKVEDPRYNEKALKEVALDEYMEQSGYEEYNKFVSGIFNSVIDTYFLYEKCGFSKLLKQEKEIEELENSIKDNAETILGESKEAAVKVGNSILNVVKPYGEVAKGQFDDAKGFAKSAVNKGTKKLIKLFEDLENKTKKK